MDYQSWNEAIFEMERRRREAEFEKMLEKQRAQERKEEPSCQSTLFDSTAESAGS